MKKAISLLLALVLCLGLCACSGDNTPKETETPNIDNVNSSAPASTGIGDTPGTENTSTDAPAGLCKDGHMEVILPAVAATCTETGLTEGKYCSVCNAVIVEQQVVAQKGHTVVVDPEQPATCTATGISKGSHCSVCNQVLEKQTVVEKTAHNEVKTEAVLATCTTDGMTEGSQCSVCGTVLRSQEWVPAYGHSYSDWSVTQDATCSQEGHQTRSCSRCGDTQNESIPAKKHQYAQGKCTVCGEAQPASTNLKFSLSKDGKAYVCDGWSTYGSHPSVLIIPATYNGKPVIGISDYAFISYNGNLKTVILPEGLQFIGSGVFDYNPISSIVIPDSVTKIDALAFSNCGMLENVYINTTGWKKSNSGESVDFSDPFETANKLRSEAFYGDYIR